ncbi:putative transmembrane protein [Klebsiella pneumoniae]|nr:putative transmembrane protein [Klebsiella pneumoniae]
MAGNAFDFELNADDRASGQITVLEEKIRSLNPALDEARDKLKLGGDESVTGLRGIGDLLRDVSEEAKSGVQSIGDMIPPLKNFGALAGKLTGIGGIGALVAGGSKLITSMSEEGKNITTSAANTGMTVEESTRLSGTLQQKGVSKDDARGQMEGYYEKLSQAVIGKDDQLLASIRSIGADVVRRPDGSADVTNTLLSIEKAIKTLPEHRNWELRDNLKLTPDMIALLREGDLQGRLNKSDKFGLTMDGEFAEKMTEVDTQLSEAGAKLTGKMNQIQKSLYEFIDSPSIIPDFGDLDGAMKNIRESELRINDTEDNFYHGDKRQDIIRWAAKDKEYRDSLSWFEDLRMTALDPDDKMYTDIYNKWSDKWEEQRERAEAGKNKPALNSKVPDNWVQDEQYNPNRRGLRNNNPGNLIAAPNSTGYDYGNDHRYVKFGSSRDGIAAMSRQLMLDAEDGLNTFDGLLQKYAPAKAKNNTQGYIDRVSKGTGFGPHEPLNMHDPNVLAKVIPHMIKVENIEQPYSYQEVMDGIMDSIMDDRWKGLRNPDKVREQRDMIAMQQTQQQETASAATDFKIDKDPTQALLAFTEQLSQVLQENKAGGTLEIVLTNAETGTKSTVNVKPKGRVTTAMNMP